jgi:hypothetical protein
MRRILVIAALAATGASLAVAPAAVAAPPAGTGNCVSFFTTAVAQAGIAGPVISFGAQELQPFGRDIVREQAAAELGDCPNQPPVG